MWDKWSKCCDGRPNASSWFVPLATFLFGCTASVLVYCTLVSDQRRTAAILFDERASERASLVAEQFRTAVADLYATQALYASSANVERAEFNEFVSRLLLRKEGLQSIAWVPRDSRQPRDAAKSRAPHESPSNTTPDGADKNQAPPDEQPITTPATLVVTDSDLDVPCSFELSLDSATLDRLDQAVSTGDATILPHDNRLPGPQYIRVVVPVYENKTTPRRTSAAARSPARILARGLRLPSDHQIRAG